MPLELTKDQAKRLAIGTKNRATRGKPEIQERRRALAANARSHKKVKGFAAATKAISDRIKLRKKLAQEFEDEFRH